MIRKEAVKLASRIIGNAHIISANGYISRDLFETDDKETNFYMLGSMGLASSIGLGIALKNLNIFIREIYLKPAIKSDERLEFLFKDIQKN